MRPDQCKDCPNVHIVPNENKNRTRYYCAATGKRGGKYKPIVKIQKCWSLTQRQRGGEKNESVD